MDEIVITDDKLRHFNIGKSDNEESSIIYENKDGLHTIVLESCSINYSSVNPLTNRCVGESNAIEFYIDFYTSGILTKVVFKKNFYRLFQYNYLLGGTNKERFYSIIEKINQCGFNCFEVSKIHFD